ncbi:8931_t:CDS:2 [Entrophospora sp. SA101]|nr:3720_t:CDS:2 [Entrophospora sp. SA101]CAJ0750920.1 8931_t:CDS:2 [Entrophospora sp. SA101]CAJ0834047.1 157_t:CDS:2 [Entrophospora sp. SA101]CAJ0842636.1 19906_t:CDS:2 [Entrophospora sp. SA101]
MSCDLSDPAITVAYEEIVNGQDTNWLILGYHDTRDKISLYSKGSQGLDELRSNLKDEVLYGFLRIENKFVLLTYVTRALVHGRAVGALFKQAHQIQISASTPNDLTEANVRNRLKLSDPSDKHPPTPKRGNTNNSSSTNSSISQIPSPTSPKSTENESFPVVESEEIIERTSSPPQQSQEDIERQAREKEEQEIAIQRHNAEKVAKEAAQRRALEEKQKQEELEKKERDAAEAKARAEVDRKNREESERKRSEELRSKFAELEKSGKVTLNGYITVQGGGVYFWKRRFFELRGKTLYLFCDENDKLPISKLELDGQVSGVTDAQSEVLILNSFKVDFKSSESYYFFSDDKKDKESIVTAIGRYVK